MRISPRTLRRHGAFFSTLMLAIALSVSGCSSNKRILREPPEDILPVQPVSFLTGPSAALLTNSTGFSARITIDPPANAKSEHGFVGQLLGRGNLLLLSPEKGDRIFIWNVTDQSGFVLSEALQGYSAFASSIHPNGITTVSETAGLASERINGYLGHQVEVSITMDDGTTNRFSIWRASDFGGFPMRISAAKGAMPMVVNLTNFKLEVLNPKLFMPPDGFTRYAKPKVMADELMSRKSKQRNGRDDSMDDLPVGPPTRTISH